MGYRLTRNAAEDIADIYLHGLQEFGPRQADAYHPLQSHLVIYRLENDGDVLIIRIRHAHEDWHEGHP